MFWHAVAHKEEAVEETTATPWPALHETLWVRLPCCPDNVHPSRVEGHEDGMILVSAPCKPHAASAAPEAQFAMGWTTEDSDYEVGVEFVQEVDGDVPVWKARAVTEFERRAAARLEAGGKALIYFARAFAPIAGHITDLSREGMGLTIPTGILRPKDSAIEVSFDIDGHTTMLLAEIAWWGAEVAGSRPIGLKFTHGDERSLSPHQNFAFDF